MADSAGDGTVGGVDIKGLAEFLSVTQDPASDPAGFIQALLAKLDEVRSKLSGDASAPVAEGGDMGADPAMATTTTRALVRLTGASDGAAAVRVVEQWQRIVLTHAAESAKLAKSKEQLELSERVAIARELVHCGATPATSGLSSFTFGEGGTVLAGQLADHLAVPSLEKLRARRDALVIARAANGGANPDKKPVAKDGEQVVVVDGQAVTLSAHDVLAANANKVPLEKMARARLRAGYFARR